ncbi:hypothetical protein ADL04_04390 [Streptomyces sp. NRRL B-3648]|nr:hypothetical protein ADL04_04390 [Streptomyces sp. NRRL B-3648]
MLAATAEGSGTPLAVEDLLLTGPGVHRGDEQLPVRPLVRADHGPYPGDMCLLGAGLGSECDPAHSAPRLGGVRGGHTEHGERLAQPAPVHLGRSAAGVGGAHWGGEPVEVLAGGQQCRGDRAGRGADDQIGLAEIHPTTAQPAGEPGRPGRAHETSGAQYECPVE